jgi:hypothetical protein
VRPGLGGGGGGGGGRSRSSCGRRRRRHGHVEGVPFRFRAACRRLEPSGALSDGQVGRALGLVGDLGDDACGAGPPFKHSSSIKIGAVWTGPPGLEIRVHLCPLRSDQSSLSDAVSTSAYCLVLLDRSTSRMAIIYKSQRQSALAASRRR